MALVQAAPVSRPVATDEAAVWGEYLDSCRQAVTDGSHIRYDEVEPWAWNRLQAKLRAIRARRRPA